MSVFVPATNANTSARSEESLPVTFADPEAAMGDLHVPTRVIHRATSRRAQEIDEQLLLAAQAVFTAMLPKPTKLRIRLQSGQNDQVRHT